MATDNIRNLSNVNFQDVPDTGELIALLGVEKLIYISKRTDTRLGSGTQLDPFNGSTATLLGGIATDLQAETNLAVCIMPGEYETDVANPMTGSGFNLNTGWKVMGAGRNQTIIKMVGNLAGQTFDHQAFKGIEKTGTSVSDMHIDCNWLGMQASADMGAGGEKNAKLGAVLLYGNRCKIRNVSASNGYGTLANTNENWYFAIGSDGPVGGFDGEIDNCHVFGTTYGTYTNAFGVLFAFTNGRVHHCTAEGTAGGLALLDGINIGSCVNCNFFDNVFQDIRSIFYQDTGNVAGLKIYNNLAIRSRVGVQFANAALNDDIEIYGNTIGLKNYLNGEKDGIRISGTQNTRFHIWRNIITFDITGAGSSTEMYPIIGEFHDSQITDNISDVVAGYGNSNVSGSTNLRISGNRQHDGSTLPGLLDNVPTYVNLNTGTPTPGEAGTVFQFAGANAVNPIGLIDAFGGIPGFIGRRANGTAASKTTVVAGNVIANFGGRGYDGTAYSASSHAAVRPTGAETWTTIAHGAYLSLSTTPIGSTTLVDVGRIQPSGGASFGTQAIALADPGNGVVLAGKAARIIAVTFANAVATPVEGTIQPFTDSSTSTIGGTITGGGANHVVGYYNGTNWVVIGGSGAGTSATIAVTALVLKGDAAGNAIAATLGTDYLSSASNLNGSNVASGTVANARLTAAMQRLIAGATAVSGATPNIDWSLTTKFSITLSANATFTFTNATDGQDILIEITNTASNYTVTWPAGLKWSTGSAPTQTVGAKIDVYGFAKVGSTIDAAYIQNLS